MKVIDCRNYTAISATREGYKLLNADDAPYKYHTAGDTLYCSLNNVPFCYIGTTKDDILYCFRTNERHGIISMDDTDYMEVYYEDIRKISKVLMYNKYIPIGIALDEYAYAHEEQTDIKSYPYQKTFSYVKCKKMDYDDTIINSPPDWTPLSYAETYWMLYYRLGTPEYSFTVWPMDGTKKLYSHLLKWKSNV